MTDSREKEKEVGMRDENAQRMLRLTFHACDVEFLHARFEGGGIEAEDFGRALLSADAPVRLIENVDDMLAFHFFQRQGLP